MSTEKTNEQIDSEILEELESDIIEGPFKTVEELKHYILDEN